MADKIKLRVILGESAVHYFVNAGEKTASLEEVNIRGWYKEVTFDTQAEADAFQHGLDTGIGYNGAYTLSDDQKLIGEGDDD